VDRTNLISVADALKLLPRRISPATFARWIIVGVRRLDGERLRLRAERIGGRFWTSPEWLAEFIESQTSQYVPATETQHRSPVEESRAAARAVAALEKMGA
jgi:hypothetical protein